MFIDSDKIKRINIFPFLLKFNQEPRSENQTTGTYCKTYSSVSWPGVAVEMNQRYRLLLRNTRTSTNSKNRAIRAISDLPNWLAVGPNNGLRFQFFKPLLVW